MQKMDELDELIAKELQLILDKYIAEHILNSSDDYSIDENDINWNEPDWLNDNCIHCGEPLSSRNPNGHCDHLYYPDNCKICQQMLKDRKAEFFSDEDFDI